MIDMSGWASIGVVCDGSDRTLTRAEVRALLEEGYAASARRGLPTPPPPWCAVCRTYCDRCPRCDP